MSTYIDRWIFLLFFPFHPSCLQRKTNSRSWSHSSLGTLFPPKVMVSLSKPHLNLSSVFSGLSMMRSYFWHQNLLISIKIDLKWFPNHLLETRTVCQRSATPEWTEDWMIWEMQIFWSTIFKETCIHTSSKIEFWGFNKKSWHFLHFLLLKFWHCSSWMPQHFERSKML